MMKIRLLALALFLAVLGLALTGCHKDESPTAAADPSTSDAAAFVPAAEWITSLHADTVNGRLSVVHGIPGRTVDVYLNGQLVYGELTPATITPPTKFPKGEYRVQITPKGEDTTQAILDGTLELPAGSFHSIVAHLSEGGTPTLTFYENDLGLLRRGRSRLVVRHDADAPTVDVKLFQGSTLHNWVRTIPNLSNPGEATSDVHPGKYQIVLDESATQGRLYGPVTFHPHPGVGYIVYAVGSVRDSSFALLTQRLSICPKQFDGERDDDEDHDRDSVRFAHEGGGHDGYGGR